MNSIQNSKAVMHMLEVLAEGDCGTFVLALFVDGPTINRYAQDIMMGVNMGMDMYERVYMTTRNRIVHRSGATLQMLRQDTKENYQMRLGGAEITHVFMIDPFMNQMDSIPYIRTRMVRKAKDRGIFLYVNG